METKTLSLIAEKCPIVHCITNYVTINDCANIILAVGASPIMADDIAEVEDIVSIAGALVINIGSLNELTIPAMVRAGRRANALRRPVILDPVGVGASALRNETITKLLQEIRFSVIRGNISEIHAVAHGSGGAHGVDADAADALNSTNISGVIESAKALSNRTGAVIAISGAT
ncbi:MAG: hydroxyethylthiazole kinase, partial [Clostridia bacterium]